MRVKVNKEGLPPMNIKEPSGGVDLYNGYVYKLKKKQEKIMKKKEREQRKKEQAKKKNSDKKENSSDKKESTHKKGKSDKWNEDKKSKSPANEKENSNKKKNLQDKKYRTNRKDKSDKRREDKKSKSAGKRSISLPVKTISKAQMNITKKHEAKRKSHIDDKGGKDTKHKTAIHRNNKKVQKRS